MPFAVKLLLANAVIISCVVIGRKLPSLAGLIAAMPLTTMIVLVWLYYDDHGDRKTLTTFVEGVLWGIVPTILFFVTAWFCLKRGFPFVTSISASMVIWLLGAIIHQSLLK